MGRDIYFMPLGGGQRVGASCYYLRLGEVNIILDAGIGKERGMVFEPDLYPLVTSPLIQSLSQINQIYISHAHADHVGYLFELMGKTSRAEVYMTEITALLSQHQLYDKKYLSGGERSEVKRLKAQSMLDKITKVSYLQAMEFGSYKATFLPAGHIPGAMMILFEWKKRRILYTGDYSMESMPLTDGCMIPDDLEIDTIIMCGLHARHPGYVKKTDKLFKFVRYVLRLVKEKKISVMCRIRQLSKGIEFLKILNQRNVEHIPIFIDEVQHNDFITPELLKHIKNSKFVVVDLTHQNNGAYFEEGYAMGIGKPVIQLCRTDVTLHFDIAQKNTIMWDTESDIPQRLTNRIIATID